METPTPQGHHKIRARETLFRVAYQNQGHLLQVADYKSNMIISICTMIISAIIAIIGYGVVTGKGASYVPTFFAPVMLIVISCLVSLVFAIRAARPKFLPDGHVSGISNRSSILFFGIIAQHSQAEYLKNMKTMLGDDEQIIEQMTLDLYNQGLILNYKYNLLKSSYQVLLIGFVISVAIFGLVIGMTYM